MSLAELAQFRPTSNSSLPACTCGLAPCKKLTEKDPIPVVDFVNTTGDSVFDGTLKQALAVQPEQSPCLNVVPDQTVRTALQFIGRAGRRTTQFFILRLL
jgi:hypothetical protein